MKSKYIRIVICSKHSRTQLGDCVSGISGWITNIRHRLNSNKTYFIIIVKSRQRCKLTRFFHTPIIKHSIAPSQTVRNFGVTFDSDFNFRKHISATYRCFYHIRDLHRIRRYISLSVAKTIATTLITPWFCFWTADLYSVYHTTKLTYSNP